jgi:hypothetical protein
MDEISTRSGDDGAELLVDKDPMKMLGDVERQITAADGLIDDTLEAQKAAELASRAQKAAA